ncbi:hypothetical protein NKH18_50410 [Streptomyces sp. M10(2022)]
MALRFAGAEAAVPHQHDPPLRPTVTEADPRSAAPREAEPGGRPFTAGTALVLTGVTPVFGFNAFPELAEALRAVAPDTGPWAAPADAAPEALAVRFGELVQAGRITVGTPDGATGPMPVVPGAWPGRRRPPRRPSCG